MYRSPLPVVLAALTTLSLSACSATRSCRGDQEYLQATERPPLDLPAHVAASERMAPLVIPPVAADVAGLDPPPPCLDMPPPYFARPGDVADQAGARN